ncbi:hypothetical protein [Thermoflavimicrobium dichotomicum]|uniref:Uncharacterized protein n=1 Tax=Thermoflavimicrobium dichotomicum TaxID=46223 RepID=A0A1I3L400_9BACL|nr:hypothetical protein [Thermoflavimicrobium dichotomicum]SFI79358.1 hypothetical protein SAMN05421852_10226 [Thermoflavimicrobium dichotomicum]
MEATTLYLTEYVSLYHEWSTAYDAYLSARNIKKEKEWMEKTRQFYRWLADSKRFAQLAESDSEELRALYIRMACFQINSEELEELLNLEAQLLRMYLAAQEKNQTIRQQLMGETNTYQRKAWWKESKEAGEAIAPILLRLKALRNQTVARQGFDHYSAWSLAYLGLKEEEVALYLQQLKQVTDPHYSNLKSELDKQLGKQFDLRPEGIRFWHLDDLLGYSAPPTYVDHSLYRFLQEDHIIPLLQKTIQHFRLTGTKEKMVHFHPFEQRISGAEECVVLGQKESTPESLGRLLYDIGRNYVYAQLQPLSLMGKIRDLPIHHAWGICLEQLVYQRHWLKEVAQVSDEDLEPVTDEALLKQAQFAHLMKLRYHLAVATFERDFYSQEDQDWHQHWWDLVEMMQFIPRPETYRGADWAVSAWIGLEPNPSLEYLSGILLAMQLREQAEQQPLFAPVTMQTIEKVTPLISQMYYPSFQKEEMETILLRHWPKPEPKPAPKPRHAPAKS